MSKEFMSATISKPKKFKGAEKVPSSELIGAKKLAMPEFLGTSSASEYKEEGLEGANKIKYSPSSMPKAKKAKSEDMMKLDSMMKMSKMKSGEMDPEESVHNAKEEAAEGYSLDDAGQKYSKESPKVKKAYEEWIKSKKHLKMMGE